MQYTSGTVAITNGGTVFVASAGEDWTDAKTELDSGHLVMIKVAGTALVYTVASLTTPASNAGHTPASRWEANIVGVIGDATAAAASYVLHWNFTPNFGLPIPSPGDVDVEAIMGRAFSIIDALPLGSAPGGGTGQTYQFIPVSIATSVDSLQNGGFRHEIRVLVGAGSGGAYTATVVLPIAGQDPGDTCEVHMDFAASTNPTIQIWNKATSGTGSANLWQWTGDGTARAPWAKFTFDGTAWYLADAGFNTQTPLVGGTGTGQSFQAVSVSASGNDDSTQSSFRHRARVTVLVGAGAYNRTFTLLTAGRGAGDECRVSMAFPASSNPTYLIKSSTGTPLWSYNSVDAVAINLWAMFVFDGTTSSWYLDSDGVTS